MSSGRDDDEERKKESDTGGESVLISPRGQVPVAFAELGQRPIKLSDL